MPDFPCEQPSISDPRPRGADLKPYLQLQTLRPLLRGDLIRQHHDIESTDGWWGIIDEVRNAGGNTDAAG